MSYMCQKCKYFRNNCSLDVPTEIGTVRLRIIGRGYRNEPYRTISGIIPNMNAKSAHAQLLRSRHALRENVSPTWRFLNVMSLNFFWKRETRQESATNFVVRFVKNVRRRKLSSFNMTTRGLTLHVWPCRQFTRLETALPSTLQSGFSPSDYRLLGPWKKTWEVITTILTRQSRKPCEAGCEELERTSTAEASLRFCNAGRNA